MSEWGGKGRAACAARVYDTKLRRHIALDRIERSKIIAQQGADLKGYETALTEMEEALQAVPNECNGSVGRITWPPGVRVVNQASEVLAKYRLPTRKGTDHAEQK